MRNRPELIRANRQAALAYSMAKAKLPKKSKSAKCNGSDYVLVPLLKSASRFDMVREYKFHPTRKWRFDFAYPGLKVALEKEGGVFMGSRGRHTNGGGFTADCEKYSVAASMGWLVIRATTAQINKLMFLAWLRDAISLRELGGAE